MDEKNEKEDEAGDLKIAKFRQTLGLVNNGVEDDFGGKEDEDE